MRKHLTMAATGFAVVALGGAGASVALGGGQTDAPVKEGSDEAFALLAEPPAASTPAGNPFATEIALQMAANSGMRPIVAKARAAWPTGAGEQRVHPLWVAPTEDGQLCMAEGSSWESGALRINCAPAAVVRESGLFASSKPSPAVVRAGKAGADDVSVSAFVPDGVKSVTWAADGKSTTVPVSDNVAKATLGGRPGRADLLAADGTSKPVDLGGN